MSDAEVLRDWRARLRRVCKPCWELKYCPYGPLVEQSPILPAELPGTLEHNAYLADCLKNGTIGQKQALAVERREQIAAWLKDEELLAFQARHQLFVEDQDARVSSSDDPGLAFSEMFDLPPIEQYRVNYDVMDETIDWSNLSKSDATRLRNKIREHKASLKKALKEGYEDNRRPLDPGRRAMFERQLATFNAENHPSETPEIFRDGECNIFGHICPVFFAAEATTETTTERRRGRYIPFSTKMRVVRRDNHTCQHCKKHLADDEVEFDHKIPVSKGGSSEEHNLRLTCFKCNRDKSDDYVP